jgi:hypothetical protein
MALVLPSSATWITPTKGINSRLEYILIISDMPPSIIQSRFMSLNNNYRWKFRLTEQVWSFSQFRVQSDLGGRQFNLLNLAMREMKEF